jgi:predicted  nucleic acid-binding Zn-ribbon protein
MMQKLKNSKETSKVSDQERVNSLNNALNNLPSTNDKIQNKINEMRNRVEKDKASAKKPVKTHIESSNTGGQTHVRTKTSAPVKGHGHEDTSNNADA